MIEVIDKAFIAECQEAYFTRKGAKPNKRRSTLTETQIQAFESDYGIELPPLFRAYLASTYQGNMEIGTLNDFITFPAITATNPLKALQAQLAPAGWGPLLRSGYIPFAEIGDGGGPVCFDTQHKQADGDCAIIGFDSDALISLSEDEIGDRTTLETLATDLYRSFREMMIERFTKE